MKLIATNILGIRSARLEVPPGTTAEVRAPNAEGKTSICSILRALLTQDADPLSLGRKAGIYTHDGEKRGDARLTVAGRRVTWSTSPRSMKAKGGALVEQEALAIGMGGYDFTISQPQSNRGAMMAALFGTAVLAAADVRQAVGGADAWSSLAELDAYFDADDTLDLDTAIIAERVCRDRAREGKAHWAALAGESYGAAKAADWEPDILLGTTRARGDVEGDRNRIQMELAELDRESIVSEARAAQAAEAEAELPHAHALLAEAEAELEPLQNAANAARASIHAQSQAVLDTARRLQDARDAAAHAHAPLECPVCQAVLRLQDGSLVTDVDDHAAAKQALQDAVAQAQAAHGTAMDDHTAAKQHNAEIMAALEVPMRKASQLRDHVRDLDRAAKLAAGATVDTVDRRDRRQALEIQLADARAWLDAHDRAKAATAAHTEVVRWLAAADAVTAGSPLWQAANAARDEQRAQRDVTMASICEDAGWPAVRMDSEGIVTVGGRPVQLCSGSERWIAQAVCQTTAAVCLGLTAVVLDESEILDGRRRRGLDRILERLNRAGMHTVVCTAVSDHSDAPPPLTAADAYYSLAHGTLEAIAS